MDISYFEAVSRFTYMQHALIAAALVGILSGVVGSFVVVRGMSFFGDALAHSVLPGVTVAYIYGGGVATLPLLSDFLGLFGDESVRLFVGGLIAGVGSAILIGLLTRDGRLKEDTAIGIIFVAMFALGIAIISTDPRAYGRDLLHILFGNMLAIDRSDITIMLGSTVFVVGIVILLFKELVVISFDSELAQALKLPSEGLRLLLLILIAVTIVASLQTVGIVMMLSLLITPAATAQLLVKRMPWMVVVASLIGVLGGFLGTYVSWQWQVPIGPAIVMVMTAGFVAAFFLTSVRSWLVPQT